ncbi:hypothetical protein [Pseudofrankia asymbiotica]|uniref:hypothetical protein n=1 Tax=Pseudofrankia asymbiotica TaxID=1834516 RepID=UPI001054C7F3|nr:hypothetical protein [Pseudofrankia asymbiotica]
MAGLEAEPTAAETTVADGASVQDGCAEIEVTLAGFDPEVEQMFDGYIEALDPSGVASHDPYADPSLPQCVRIACRVSYDSVADEITTVVYYPSRSNPALGDFARVPAATRRALPVVVLDAARPLQLRAGGNLRHIVDAIDPGGAKEAFASLRKSVSAAVDSLSAESVITSSVGAVLGTDGAAVRIGEPVVATDVGFVAEDGTVGSLLRALQPAVKLDCAGLLPLSSHGSTTTAVFSAAEAMLVASVPGAIVLADDFGGQLDTTATEHVAAMLRARAGQVWLSTRRPEAARAFDPADLVRLVRPGGIRSHHQLERITDRKALAARGWRVERRQAAGRVVGRGWPSRRGDRPVAGLRRRWQLGRRYPAGHVPGRAGSRWRGDRPAAAPCRPRRERRQASGRAVGRGWPSRRGDLPHSLATRPTWYRWPMQPASKPSGTARPSHNT